MIKKILFLCTFLVLVIVANSQQIPKWKMDDVVRFYSKNNDTTYLINFWSTASKTSVEQMPLLQNIEKSYEDKKVKLLMVNLDSKKVYGTILKNFLKKQRINAQVVWLNETIEDMDFQKIDSIWKGGLPATLIINNTRQGYRNFLEEKLTEQKLSASILSACRPFLYSNHKHRYIAPYGNPFFLTPLADAAIYNCLEMIKDPYVARCWVTYFTSNKSNVYSMSSGRVYLVGTIGAYDIIHIKTDSANIIYYNMEKVFVSRCDSVSEGQILGVAYKGLHYSNGDIYHKNDFVTGIEMGFQNIGQKEIEKNYFIIRKNDD